MMDLFDIKGIKPMLISEQKDPYDDKNSIFELKLDGIRCIAYCVDTTDLRNKRDIEVSGTPVDELRNMTAYVPQECPLFEGTIFQNIAMGGVKYPEKRYIKLLLMLEFLNL